MTQDSPNVPAPDPFDLDSLREIADLTEVLAQQVMTTVPIRRPSGREFFRVCADPKLTTDAYLYEREEGMDRQSYWVSPQMRVELIEWVLPTRLFLCANKEHNFFLWPAKLPTNESNSGRMWRASALSIAETAKEKWVRMKGNKTGGYYDLFVALGNFGEPAWPDKTLRELLEIAYKDRIIDSEDHAVVRELRGLV